MDSGSLNRPNVVDSEKFFQKYEAMKEDYDALRRKYADVMASHSATANKLELAQDEVNRLKQLYDEAHRETSTAIRERNGLKQQCRTTIQQWDSALLELREYKEALAKVQQQHEEAMKEVNQGMARSIKSSKEIKRLTEERDAVRQEYSLIMSERDSVHRELEKLTDDLSQAKKQVNSVETQNKELHDKVTEAGKEAEVSLRTRDWAFSERDKIMREKESLRTLCESLRRERDRATSDLAEAIRESEEVKRQKNLASRQLKELRDRLELEKENKSMRFQYFSNSSSFSESRDSAIDSDLPSGHYSIKLPNVRGADHGLVLEPGVYISRIVPGSPAAKETNLNIGDRVLFINDTPIDNVQDAILALSEDIDPILLTLSRSAGHLPSPIHPTKQLKGLNINVIGISNRLSNHASASNSSLKSDRSDGNLTSGRVGTAHNSGTGSRHGSGTGGSSGGSKSHGGLRDIFRVKLPRRKLSSPEVEILETLDSAIASGGGGSSSHRKLRKNKRASSRGSGGAGEASSISKNGTWPRVMLNSRNSSCSYTLPHNGAGGTTPQQNQINCDFSAISVANEQQQHYAIPHHAKMDSGHFYATGQYIPNSNNNSRTICGVRRPSSGKERISLSSLGWNLEQHQQQQQEHQTSNSKSAGAINNSNSSGNGNNLGLSLMPKSLTMRNRQGDDRLQGLTATTMRGTTGNPAAHHRYSFGVFDPSSLGGGKISKGDQQRNSVVPTLTMSDGSSIDFSVKSGNMDSIMYYMKRNISKNHNNSSESDHLDKVVTPPSLALPCSVGIGSGESSSNVLSSPLSAASTLNRYSNRFPSRYSGHHHDSTSPLSVSMNAQMLNPIQIPPMSISKSMQSGSMNSTGFKFEPSFQQHSHSHGSQSDQHSLTPSTMSLHSNSNQLFRNSGDLLLHPSYPIESSGTFPRKREPQRIRIPSNQSVTSRSSTEKFEMRNSPMPTYHIEKKPRSGTHPRFKRRVLEPGNTLLGGGSAGARIIKIDKQQQAEPLGIQITCKPKGGGVFVSSVTEGSVASKANLRVGDQLLEVCGINMRSATYDHAAHVLKSCKDNITMLVQYIPGKFHTLVHENGSSSEGEFPSDGSSSSADQEDDNNSSISENESRSSERSGSPTPCNSPQSTLVRNSKRNSSIHKSNTGNSMAISGNVSAGTNSLSSSSKSNQSQQQSQHSQQVHQQALAGGLSHGVQTQQDSRNPHTPSGTLTRQSTGGGGLDSGESGKTNMLSLEQPRYLTLQLPKNSSNLGIHLVGGNVFGIFVHSVQPESIADRSGLRTGDQILEYNGTELRQATAEEAAFELAKPLEKVTVVVQYNIKRYNEIKDQPGDGFYIRALFDYPTLSNDSHHSTAGQDQQHLSFHKDEILYVDNTMYNGKPGRWRAWKVDSEGHRRLWGVIPSKFKIEEDLMFKRSLGDIDNDPRSSTVTRRSFFRRKSHHRSSSREIASFSDFSINSYGDISSQHSGMQLKEDSMLLNSYQRVERLDCLYSIREGRADLRSYLRPVIILGALSDLIAERLVHDCPYQFGRVVLETQYSAPLVEHGLADNLFIDYKRKGTHFECVTMAAIKEISVKKLYCILDVSTAGIERLQRAQMYPIVLLVKFKSPKQIKDIKDLRCDKISAKEAKEFYEHSLKVENEYKHLITACVPGGTNISYLATQAKATVEKEQSKTLWVPV